MIGSKMRRRLLSIHRWMGSLCALFLVLLSISGLLLNHNVKLGLDQWIVRSPLILKRYGMIPEGPIESIRISNHMVGLLDGILYLNGAPVIKTGPLIGGFESAGILVVVHANGLVLLDAETGFFVDEIDADSITIDAVGYLDSGREVFRAGDVFYGLDEGFSELVPLGSHLQWSGAIKNEEPLPGPIKEKMLIHYGGNGVSVYRILLDIHAGRFFGVGGTILMDLTALCILYLVGSGLLVWRSRKSKKKESGEG